MPTTIANPNFPNNPGYNLYKGARYVPKFSEQPGSVWTNTIAYEPLTIVLWEGNSYTSKTFVPVGVDIKNDTYWAQTGNYNAQVEQYRQDVLNIQNYFNNLDINNVYNYGAVGDGVTDDTEAFEKAISENNKIILEPNKTYKLSNLTITSPLDIDLNGSHIYGEPALGTDLFIINSDNVSIHDGTIESHYTFFAEDPSGRGGCINAQATRDGSTSIGYHNIRLYNLHLICDSFTTLAFNGGMYNVTVDNIRVTGKGNVVNAIACEWSGGAHRTPPTTTYNLSPYNISFNNIIVENYTNSNYGNAFWLAASYSIKLSNITVLNCTKGIYVWPGDHGNQYSPDYQKPFVGITHYVTNYCWAGNMTAIQIESGYSPVNIIVDGFVINNPQIERANSIVLHSDSAVFKNGIINGGNTGIVCGGNCTIENCKISNTGYSGITQTAGTMYLKDSYIQNVNLLNSVGKIGAFVVLNAGAGNTFIENCLLGNGSESNMHYNIYKDSPSNTFVSKVVFALTSLTSVYSSTGNIYMDNCVPNLEKRGNFINQLGNIDIYMALNTPPATGSNGDLAINMEPSGNSPWGWYYNGEWKALTVS